MTLPPKRKVVKFGITRAPQREWPRHRKFVRAHSCCVFGCNVEPIEFAHVRQGNTAGTGQKPFDWNGVSLCWQHHDEQHQLGHIAFDKKYHLKSLELAAEFARKSPDTAMREAMAEATKAAAE